MLKVEAIVDTLTFLKTGLTFRQIGVLYGFVLRSLIISLITGPLSDRRQWKILGLNCVVSPLGGYLQVYIHLVVTVVRPI